MADDSKPGGRSRILAWTAALVIGIPVLYVLSIGPAAVMVQKTGGIKSPFIHALEAIYTPLIWLCNNNKHFGDLLDAYPRMFGLS
jgi:hypothetical protein